MIKHQILIVFLCSVVVIWVAYAVREHRKSRDNEEQEENNDSQEENS